MVLQAFVLVLIISGIFYYQKLHVNTMRQNHQEVMIMQSGKMQKVELKPVAGIMQHTDLVGTPESPTVDGGIINAADGLAVNLAPENDIQNAHPKLVYQNSVTKTVSKKDIEKTDGKSEDKKEHAFQDNWATSKRVKVLLQEAAKSGKLDYVLQKIDERGLPASLATIPMIESGYQELAMSKKGAAGLWQLMPATAKDYGINSIDRYQFGASTSVALDLLENLHKQFGSWELALAAYNAGAGRVTFGLHKNPRAKSIQELDLPKETKEYVLRIMNLNQKLAAVSQ